MGHSEVGCQAFAETALAKDCGTGGLVTLHHLAVAADYEWLTIIQLLSCSPDLNPVEGIWSLLR
ncbi:MULTISPECIES: hypothetical protein [unclassified Streptomyces]|uniref:hypothetical protein n=1 Tax=unclassified Streptomyces TaxID=2593676 RepID=UPI0016516A0D|nr:MULTISPECIES: hypothetical protein [unclassified Streptomyces]